MKKTIVCFLMVVLAGMNSCASATQPSSQNRSATPSATQASPSSTAPVQQAVQPIAAQPQPIQLAQASQPQAQVQPPAAASRPKVAVYVTGGKNASENKALAARMTHGLVNSGRYSAIERTDAFLDQVAKEMVTQRSGAIDDKQISELGRQAGANFVCVAEILAVFGDHQISARIINVVSVEVVASGVAEGALKNINDFAVLSNQVVASLLGVAQSAVTVSGTTTTSAGQAVTATPPSAQSVTVPTTTSNTITDPRDGKTYRTVKIGKLTWMAQNLNFRPRTDNTWCYGNDNDNCDKYGRLYLWDAAMSACPAGWRLPTKEDWDDLIWEADGKDAAGSRLKSKSGWSNNGNGTDKFGFSALPGGRRDGSFDNVGTGGYWWSATEFGSGIGYVWYRRMLSDNSNVDEDGYRKSYGFSVRCVR